MPHDDASEQVGSAPAGDEPGMPALVPEPVVEPSASGGPPTPSRRPRAARVTAVVLAVVLLATAITGVLVVNRLLDTNRRWQASSNQWEALAQKQGAQAAKSQSEAAQLQVDLNATTKELATAKKRISKLADEKAQLGDKSATSQELAAYQTRVSQAAADVATSLGRCIDGQRQLITYVDDASRYDPADLARYRSDVKRLCGQATDANAALQSELKK